MLNIGGVSSTVRYGCFHTKWVNQPVSGSVYQPALLYG